MGEIKKTLARMQERAAEIEATAVLQLPLWPEAKRGTPNTFLRSALFSAIQGKAMVQVSTFERG